MKRLIPSLFLAVAAAVSLACAHVHHPRPLPGTARVTKPGPLLHTLQRMAMATTTTPPSWRLVGVRLGGGVYLVVGCPEHYYAEDRFYRHVDGAWYVSTELKARRAVLELRLGV